MRTAVLSPWVEERLIGGKSQEGSFPGGWTRSVSRFGHGSHGRMYLLRLIQLHASFLCMLLFNHTSIKKENDKNEVLGKQQKTGVEVPIRRLARYVTFHLTLSPSACSDSSVKNKKFGPRDH